MDDDDIPKKQRPAEATISALKMLVDETIGYKHLKDKKIKFEGFTAAGHDLSDKKERSDALKTYQAGRDSRKLAVLALKKTTEPKSKKALYLDTSEDALAEALEENNFTPIKKDSPYSRAVFDNVTRKLSKINLGEKGSPEKIAAIYSEPAPSLKTIINNPEIIAPTLSPKPIEAKKAKEEKGKERE